MDDYEGDLESEAIDITMEVDVERPGTPLPPAKTPPMVDGVGVAGQAEIGLRNV